MIDFQEHAGGVRPVDSEEHARGVRTVDSEEHAGGVRTGSTPEACVPVQPAFSASTYCEISGAC